MFMNHQLREIAADHACSLLCHMLAKVRLREHGAGKRHVCFCPRQVSSSHGNFIKVDLY